MPPSKDIGFLSKATDLHLRRGTLQHVKGFILDQLYSENCLDSEGHHGRHKPIKNLRGGYDPKYHGLFDPAIEELKREGLILVFKARTGKGSDWHVVITKDALIKARPLMNAFRKSVGLRRWNQEFTGLLDD